MSLRPRRRDRRAQDRQALIPSEPSQLESLAGRQLVVHVGPQTMRVPVEFLVAYFTRQMQGVEEWKKGADPLSMTLYLGVKQSLNIMIPLLREFMKRAAPDMPQLPERPRHSDPIVYLLGYMNAFTCDYVTRGEFTIPVDEQSEMVTGFEWSYLDELRGQVGVIWDPENAPEITHEYLEGPHCKGPTVDAEEADNA
jgi:hypothetical protein